MAILTILITAIFAVPITQGTSDQQLPNDVIPVVAVPSLDYIALSEEDQLRENAGLPPRFAVPHAFVITPSTHGLWEQIDEDTVRWSLRVACDNAVTMNVGFGKYNMPSSGSMTIRDPEGLFQIRPFTADDNKLHGELWTPTIPGGEMVIQITVQVSDVFKVVHGITLVSINAGYRWLRDATGRGTSESCNVDVMCSEGDPWWNEIPSVGVYTLNGTMTCSGVMLNNTALDQVPYFLTADHCGLTSGNDATIVVYWNYQNSYCRAPGSGESGGAGDGSFSQFTTGSTLRASRSLSDFALTELSSNPNLSWGVTFAGWSRLTSASIGAGIHHPEGAEKRISIPNSVNTSGDHWEVNWAVGRTAPGSSGSPLFDSDHYVIGQLCCGSSYCWNDFDDYYGRSFILAWQGGLSNSLHQWLDPIDTDPQTLDTLVPTGVGDPQGACCINQTCTFVTEIACNNAWGQYQGDYVSCATNPCAGAPTGACCVNVQCTVMTDADCLVAGGTYLGDGSVCNGNPCGAGCQVGYSPDCVGTCFEDAVFADWAGDGFCDDGAFVPSDYGYGGPAGVPIFLNCPEYNCDNNDCVCDGSGCAVGEIEDCNGNCCPASWVGDGLCDDGTYVWLGNPIYLNCAQFNCDAGDCICTPIDPTGACCIDSVCAVLLEIECSSTNGVWVGPDTTCDAGTCIFTCQGDVNEDGAVNVSDLLAIIGVWNTADPNGDINNDGIVNVSDMLAVIAAWGSCI